MFPSFLLNELGNQLFNLGAVPVTIIFTRECSGGLVFFQIVFGQMYSPLFCQTGGKVSVLSLAEFVKKYSSLLVILDTKGVGRV